jgi:phosphohistidine phosphatase
MDDHIPDRILSSPANRALHTAVIFARILDYPLEHLIICKTLYESSADKILTLIKNTPQNYRSLMIFGHNPDVTHLVDHFVKMSEDLPTSGVATLVFNSETWNGITPENLDHKSFFFPKRDE